jgi:hypothetical protein
MSVYQYLAFASLGVCMGTSLFHMMRLIRLGKPMDFAPAAGKTGPAIQYSFTGAMNPAKKESAFLHLPTYSAGILYHLGTFLSVFLFLLILVGVPITGIFAVLLSVFFIITGGCGIGILVKRMVKHELRSLSSPDDYISNVLVSLFHLTTSLALMVPAALPGYFILASTLLLYFPIGKLKHAIYFFAARYHLGLFFGRRGVWPPKPM